MIEPTYLDQRLINQPETARTARAYRESNGVTRPQVARLMDISVQQVYFLEHAQRSWTLESFERFVNAVNATKTTTNE